MIIGALLLFSIILALGLGLLSSQTARMEAARAQMESVQAKSLALAAWADVRAKLGKDLFFPPNTRGQDYFSYSEDLEDEDGFFGTYTVMIDCRWERFSRDQGTALTDSFVDLHEGIYLITCVGKVGERDAPPRSERVLYYEVDMTTFKVIRAEDRGSL